MSTNHLSLILGAIGVLLGPTSILLTILFAIFGALAGLIVAAFLIGGAVGATGSLLVCRYRPAKREAAELTIARVYILASFVPGVQEEFNDGAGTVGG